MNFRSTLKKRIIAAITSVAMAGTFIPELAAPVLAEEVRKEIEKLYLKHITKSLKKQEKTLRKIAKSILND